MNGQSNLPPVSDSLQAGASRWRRAFPVLICISLSVVFGIAAFGKLSELNHLEESIELTQVLPGALVDPLAKLLIAAELLVPATLLFRCTRPAGLMLVVALSAIFFGYSAWRLYQDIRVPCNCFGVLFKIPPAGSMALSFAMSVAAQALLTAGGMEPAS